MSTQFPSKNAIARQWHVLDAEDAVLGKLASKAAMLLMGKHKAIVYPIPGYRRSRSGRQRRQSAAYRP
jgi:ribosomal protein L13